MGKRTPFYDCHLQSKAKIVDFAGWDMPLHYGSQLQEHHQVRLDAGVFDVSHMAIVDVTGKQANAYLHSLLANNIDKLSVGKALYSCMLNEQGGVIDDLIVYVVGPNHFRLVANSSTHDKDMNWLHLQARSYDVSIKECHDIAMLALQGPKVREKMTKLFSAQTSQAIINLKPFHCMEAEGIFIACTGYTGEDGYEIMLAAKKAPTFWQALLNAGFKPCGLGARDTLRLEAGFNLYGADMDETVTPLESNLAWTVAFQPQHRSFIGRLALEQQLSMGLKKKLVGVVLMGPGVLRNHQKVFIDGAEPGEITSGSFSPTLHKGIALARVPVQTTGYCTIDMRGKLVPALVIKPPFVCQGKQAFDAKYSNMMER
jgi:aminomethyltransferase